MLWGSKAENLKSNSLLGISLFERHQTPVKLSQWFFHLRIEFGKLVSISQAESFLLTMSKTTQLHQESIAQIDLIDLSREYDETVCFYFDDLNACMQIFPYERMIHQILFIHNVDLAETLGRPFGTTGSNLELPNYLETSGKVGL